MTRLSRFDQTYAALLIHVLNQRPTENRRTKKRVKAVPGTAIGTEPGEMPILSLRDINVLWPCAEAVWFLSGENDARWMHQFDLRAWDKFCDHDFRVWSATGWRWRSGFQGVDQVQNLLNRLAADPSDRQGVLMTWDPKRDAVKPGPNAPCLTTWHFQIMDGALHCSVMQRSCDLYFGLPHDMLGAHVVQALLAAGLGARIGSLSFLVCNAHLYEDQWQAAEEMAARLVQEVPSATMLMPFPSPLQDLAPSYCDDALAGRPQAAWELKKILSAYYRPMPKIAGPKLVV